MILFVILLGLMISKYKDSYGKHGLSIEVEYVTDMEKIVTYGIMSMPEPLVKKYDNGGYHGKG